MALEIDPVPQGQINSDKRKSDAAFACFLDDKVRTLHTACLRDIELSTNNLAARGPRRNWHWVKNRQQTGLTRKTSHPTKVWIFQKKSTSANLRDRVIVGQLREIYSTKIKDILNA